MLTSTYIFEPGENVTTAYILVAIMIPTLYLKAVQTSTKYQSLVTLPTEQLPEIPILT